MWALREEEEEEEDDVVVDGGGVVGLASVVGIVDFWCLFSSR